jgi:hypothetical protein
MQDEQCGWRGSTVLSRGVYRAGEMLIAPFPHDASIY